MTLDEKARIVEVLMLSGDSRGPHVWSAAFRECSDEDRKFARQCVRIRKSIDVNEYVDQCIEAAYRLIESSPTLRREWFGR